MIQPEQQALLDQMKADYLVRASGSTGKSERLPSGRRKRFLKRNFGIRRHRSLQRRSVVR